MEVGGVSLKADDPAYIIGRGIVVHEGEDDLGLGGLPDSTTTGAAGPRFSCCVIEAIDNDAVPENGECTKDVDGEEEDDANEMDCATGLCCGTVYDAEGVAVKFDNDLPLNVCQETTTEKMWLPDDEPTWNVAVNVKEYTFKCHDAGSKLVASLAAFAISAFAMY